MGILHLEDQWPIDDGMIMIDEDSVYGDGVVW